MTAVESFLHEKALETNYTPPTPKLVGEWIEEYSNKAKEIEKQKKYEFAIGFGEWLIEKEREHPNKIIRMKGLLEIYKDTSGL